MMNLFATLSLAAVIAGSPVAAKLKQTATPARPAATAPAALTAAEQTRILADVSKALSQVKTARGGFDQHSPDGSFSSGRFAMQRPGKMRFDYDDPVPLLMVSDGKTVALQDRELKTTDRVPIGSTPLNLILSDRLDLQTQATVLDVRRERTQTFITLKDKSGEMEGTLTLRVSNADNALIGWDTVDASGGRTSVLLRDVETGKRLNPRLFVVRDFDNR